MRGANPDGDTLAAYYCFVNLGWPPSKYADLPHRERVLIAEFIHKEIKSRPKAKE